MVLFIIHVAAITVVATAAVEVATRGDVRSGLHDVATGVSCIVLIALPFAFEVLTARRLALHGALFFDLRWYVLALPLVMAHIPSLVRLKRKPDISFPVLLCAWSSTWSVFNTANHCAPGWCGWYGFPLRFYSWSDAVISLNGYTPSPFHPIALVVDLGVLAFGVIAIVRSGMRIPRRAV